MWNSRKRSNVGGHRLRRSAPRSPMQWLPLSGAVTVALGAPAVTQLLSFEEPAVTFGTPITSDPPEDQTVLRVVAELAITMVGVTQLTLGLIVVDRVWTPTGTTTIIPDLDKRFLWYRTFSQVGATLLSWQPPDVVTLGAVSIATSDAHRVDIAPKVKVEAGKALCMVAYNSSAVVSPVVTVVTMRLLLRRSAR